ncbi:MAG: hypothetical protein ACR2IK_20715, partial [Chloroflexota bacterium]
TQPEIVARVTALRREPTLRAVRTASLNEGRAMDALRILKRIDAVEYEGPVRDVLVLVRRRLDELLGSELAESRHLPKANANRKTAPRSNNREVASVERETANASYRGAGREQ